MASATKFLYMPLDTSTRSIRLAELLPETGDGVVKISLTHYRLDSSPKYEALSYTWGPPSVTPEPIQLHGQWFGVRENIYSCLRALQSPQNEARCRRLLWIDAICINPDDNREKEYSIRLMPSIYEKAERTICWTGACLSPATTRLIHHLSGLRDKFEPEQRSFISEPALYHSDIKISVKDLQFFEDGMRDFGGKGWQGLDDLLRSDYFQRLWIIQDLVCSKELVLRCNADELSWDIFCRALEVCMFYSINKCPSATGLCTVVVSDYLRCRFRHGGTLTLREMILAKQNCSLLSSDPRDHLYMLYSILRGKLPDYNVDHTYEVDYTKTLSEIYSKAAESLGPLSLSLISNSSQPTIDLASWIPDLSATRKRFLLDHPKSCFFASQWTLQPLNIFNDTQTISYIGLQLDVIKATSSYLPPRRHCDHYNVTSGNTVVFDEWFEFVSQVRRPRGAQFNNAEILIEFADTIQARGCGSIWEPIKPYASDVLERQTLDFLRLINEEEMDATLEIRLFYAACFPAHDRRFGVTERGHFCLVPQDTKRGDVVCVLHGKKVPLIFRKVGKYYQNIGEAYVNGLMQWYMAVQAGIEETIFDVA